jgi:hypothetical protein
MMSGKEIYDQSLLDSLEKKYQLFLDSPNGEINVYLVLNKDDEVKNDRPRFGEPAGSNILRQNRSFKNRYDGLLNNFS